MKLTKKQIKKELKDLRKAIDSGELSPHEEIIGCAIEDAVVFVTRNTDWRDSVGYSLLGATKQAVRLLDDDYYLVP